MATEGKTQTGGQIETQRQQASGGPISREGRSGTLTPFTLFRRWFDDMDRALETLGDTPLFGRGGHGNWSPQIDVFNRGDQFVVRADLPGMNKNDVKIEINDNALTLQGERRFEHEENKDGIYRNERSWGSFYRTIPLPQNVDTEGATANFDNGVLEICLKSLQPTQKNRRIEIQDGGTLGAKSVH